MTDFCTGGMDSALGVISDHLVEPQFLERPAPALMAIASQWTEGR